MVERDPAAELKDENARLIALLEANSIQWRAPPEPLPRAAMPVEAGIQDVFRHLANDQVRTAAICSEIEQAFRQGRKVLMPTERTGHPDARHRPPATACQTAASPT